MRSRRGRLGLAFLAAGLSVAGCGSAHSPTTQPATSTSPSTAAPTSAAPTTLDQAGLRALLLTAADLPAGFSAADVPGPDVLTLAPCGHSLAPIPASVTQVQTAFDRNGDQEQVVEQIGDLGSTAATSLVDLVSQVGTGCRQFDQVSDGKTVTLLVTPIQPPAVAKSCWRTRRSRSRRAIISGSWAPMAPASRR